MNPALPTSRRRQVSVLLRVATAVVSLGFVAASVPATADTGFWAGFESGTTNAFSGAQSVDVTADCAKSGALGAQAVSTSLTPGYLKWSTADVTQGMRYAHISTWVRIDDMADDQNVAILNVKNANGSNHFDLWRDAASGHWRWDLYRGDTAFSTMSADVGTWYHVEALVDFGGDGGSTYTAQVRINGVAQPGIESTSQVGTSVRSLWLGGPNLGYPNTRCYDSVTAGVGDSPFSFDS